MSLAARIAEQVELLPPVLKDLLDRELAAGNQLMDVGGGAEAGRVVLILNHPFRAIPQTLPPGVEYRELADRDPMVYELSTSDRKWSLMTVKFKPMVLSPIVGPPDPMPAHREVMRKHAEDEAAAAEKRGKSITGPPPSAANPTDVYIPSVTGKSISGPPVFEPPTNLGDAAKRFVASMTITYEMWHDGNGYDLDLLAQIPPDDLKSIEAILLQHRPVDWRDIEALARFDSPAARAAVVAALEHADPHVRREAMEHAADQLDPIERERLLRNALQTDDVFGGLSQAIDEAAQFHPPAIVDLLLHGTLTRKEETAVLFAGLLYYIYGKTDQPFDWNHRPFFLKFHTADRAERRVVFRELCEAIGVDAGKY